MPSHDPEVRGISDLSLHGLGTRSARTFSLTRASFLLLAKIREHITPAAAPRVGRTQRANARIRWLTTWRDLKPTFSNTLSRTLPITHHFSAVPSQPVLPTCLWMYTATVCTSAVPNPSCPSPAAARYLLWMTLLPFPTQPARWLICQGHPHSVPCFPSLANEFTSR